MNTGNQRRSRVQGGWAATSNGASSRLKSSATAVSSSDIACSKKGDKLPTNNAISQKEKMKAPIWLGKNIDQVVPKSKYVFEDPEEEIKVKAEDQVILKPGVYDISTEPSGLSRLRYFPQFIEFSRSEAIFAELYDSIEWHQRSDIHNGVHAIQPRLTQWYSDLPYTYSGITVEANTSEWPKALKELKEQLIEVTGIEFNSLAANLYRDGHDSIGWHTDDEPIMGKRPVIASLSFGEERVFELRKKPPLNESGERDYTYSQVIRIPLRSGALLIMEGCTQLDWQHRVPKEYHDRGPRINITFRVARPVEES
ncbi:alpha-ketoglutarate-dependent dioxygenase alkB 3 isoform X2 [Biomphalaria glabrata]|nr:alpha-ketoglutarate-dependent dioxygenase alkB 3 isoform X2 [Biomphalaria glabrata]